MLTRKTLPITYVQDAYATDAERYLPKFQHEDILKTIDNGKL